MHVVWSLLSRHFFKRNKTPTQSCIFYKLIHFSETNQQFTLQCINTNRLFYATIDEIIADIDILYALHPLQACYIGLNYRQSKAFLEGNISQPLLNPKKIARYQYSRYGQYSMLFQTQRGLIGFFHKTSQETFSMDARDLALHESFLSQFDAIDAFAIGLEAGKLIHNDLTKSMIEPKKQSTVQLTLVK